MSIPADDWPALDLPEGWVTSVQVTTEAGGHTCGVIASPGCPPWLVTLASRHAKQQLMPGAWQEMADD